MNIPFTVDKEFEKLYNEYVNDSIKSQLLKLEGIHPEQLDVANMSKKYFSDRLPDISIDTNANANEEISPNNYSAEITKGLLKLEGYYLLWYYTKKRYGIEIANRLIRRIWDGDIYFHDASSHGVQTIYCLAISTTPIMINGRPYGQLYSLPPKRKDSFISQVIETCMDISNVIMGAIAPSDMIINYSWYAKKERDELARIIHLYKLQNHYIYDDEFINLLSLTYKVSKEKVIELLQSNLNPEKIADELMRKDIENDFQKFVHVMNNKFRVAGQSPFTNVSLFDRPNLEKIFGDYYFPDGTQIDIEYIIYLEKIFGEFMAKGDPVTGLPYRFPICTINIAINKNKEIIDKDFFEWACKVNLDRGIFNIYVNDGNKIASCCRYISDFSEMKKYRTDTFGNGGLNIGSTRVITINLPRLAIKSNGDVNVFKVLLEEVLNDIRLLHKVHREEILKRRIDAGFIKFIKPLEWISLKNLFATVGIIGVYEMTEFMNIPIFEQEGQLFVQEVLELIENKTSQFANEDEFAYNVEEIPGESTAVIFAQKDELLFNQDKFKLYSNQYIPLIAEANIIERIKLSGKFLNMTSGGGILHLNIDEKLRKPEQMKFLIEKALQYGVPHFAINYGFGICENNHTSIVGTKETCPICGAKITDYMTRVIGYFTKISSWNKVRREYEYKRRKFVNL